MKQVPNNIQRFTPSRSNTCSSCLESTEADAKTWEPLLHKITAGFALNERESRDLIKRVYTCTPNNYLAHENHHAFKIWLVKMVVRQCIFIIGSRLGSRVGNNTGKNNDNVLSNYHAHVSAHMCNIQNIPLSFRAVFILQTVGLNESEIAAILNITALRVRERFSKAVECMRHYGKRK